MALVIEIKVVPQSGRSELILDKSGILKCFVKAPAEDGKANRDVVALIAKKLDIFKQNIEIISGLTSRKKRLMIQTSLTYEQFLSAVGLVHQKSMF